MRSLDLLPRQGKHLYQFFAFPLFRVDVFIDIHDC